MASRVSFPQRALNKRRRTWLRAHRKEAAMVILAACGLCVIVSLPALLLIPRPFAYYVLGLAHAAVVAAVIDALNSAVLAHDQQAILQMRGAWGEDNTRAELRRAKRKRVIWGWVDSIQLQAGDLDHVVLSRHGGVIVLDSKWRNQITSDVVQSMTDSARRVRLRAEALTRTLLAAERRATHRARAQPLTVTTAVVIWGAARTDVPSGTEIDGVHFVDGRHLHRWLAQRSGHEIPRDAARDALARLEAFAVRSA